MYMYMHMYICNKNGIRDACITADILDCPRHALKWCPRWCPRHAPDMPQTCPSWCYRHAPDDAPHMPQKCPTCPRWKTIFSYWKFNCFLTEGFCSNHKHQVSNAVDASSRCCLDSQRLPPLYLWGPQASPSSSSCHHMHQHRSKAWWILILS